MDAQHAESGTAESRRIGMTIRTMRELRGVSADQLARELQISAPHMRNIENGYRDLTPVLAAKIADALAVKQIAIVREGYFDLVAAEAAIRERREAEQRLEEMARRAAEVAAELASAREQIAALKARRKAVA